MSIVNIDDWPDEWIHGGLVGLGEDVPPNTVRYIHKYGIRGCISILDDPIDADSIDDIYGECLKRGCTWRELLNYKERDLPSDVEI